MVIMKTIVIGLGNTLFSDDGAGIYALNFLKHFHSDVPSTHFVVGEIFEPDFVEEILPTDNLIIIDSTQLNSEPGSVRIFMNDEMDRFLNRQSTYGMKIKIKGLIDLIKEIELADIRPQHRALVGIQPQCLDKGDRLSETVEEAIPSVCIRVLDLIKQWH